MVWGIKHGYEKRLERKERLDRILCKLNLVSMFNSAPITKDN